MYQYYLASYAFCSARFICICSVSKHENIVLVVKHVYMHPYIDFFRIVAIILYFNQIWAILILFVKFN